MGFDNATSDTIENATTRGDDVFIYKAQVDNTFALNLELLVNVVGVALGPISDLDFVDLVFTIPRDEAGEDIRIRVGKGAPHFGRIPLNYALGDTTLLTVQPTQTLGAYGATELPRSISANALANRPSCQLLFYLQPPQYVPQKRAPLVWGRGNGDVGGGIPVNGGLITAALYMYSLGRNTIEIAISSNPDDPMTDPVTITLQSYKFFSNGSQVFEETFTLATAADKLSWTRTRGTGFFPDYVQLFTQSVGTGRLLGFAEVHD